MNTFKRFGLAMLAALCFLGINAQGNKGKIYGVAFYNLENLFDTIANNPKGRDIEFTPQGDRKWDGNKYWAKIKKLSYAISQFDTKQTPDGPAVIGVSEIENRSVLEDLVKAESIKKFNYQVIHHDSPDNRGVDVGLLYNPSQFKPLGVTNHTLKIANQPNFRTRDQMCVFGLLGGQRIAFIVNHWPSRLGGEKQSSYLREAAAELCKHIADSITNLYPDCGVVIMGDLNDDPTNKSCKEILGAVKKVNNCKPGGYFNPFWQKLDDGIGSYIYRGGWDLFDQIIVNYNLCPQGPSHLEYIGALVINKDFLIQQSGQYKGYPLRTFSGGAWANGYSDHLPTQIFLKVR